MLNNLSLKGVGSAQRLDIDFKLRLNFLTGDNGLGKSFVLDIAWWALTRTWARSVVATPRQDAVSLEVVEHQEDFVTFVVTHESLHKAEGRLGRGGASSQTRSRCSSP